VEAENSQPRFLDENSVDVSSSWLSAEIARAENTLIYPVYQLTRKLEEQQVG